MNVVIYVDKYTGHLFHDIELYIVAFEKLKKRICSNVYFLKPQINYNENKVCNKWNNLLCLKLFNKPQSLLDKLDESIENVLIVDRTALDKKNINKAFATCIYNFPSTLWSELISNKSFDGKKIKILYAVRNIGRSLDNDSNNNLCNIIKKYDESFTMCDMGTLSCEEQIDTFRNHNVVLGVHGNNLSGVMWMSPGSFVFEILPINLKDKVYDYHCMSQCMKHHYTQIDCLTSGGLNSIYTLTETSLNAVAFNLKMLYAIHS